MVFSGALACHSHQGLKLCRIYAGEAGIMHPRIWLTLLIRVLVGSLLWVLIEVLLLWILVWGLLL